MAVPAVSSSGGRRAFPFDVALAPDPALRTIPMTGLGSIHMDPLELTPRIGDGLLLTDPQVAAIVAILASARLGPGSPVGSVEVRHLGGALARRSRLQGP